MQIVFALLLTLIALNSQAAPAAASTGPTVGMYYYCDPVTKAPMTLDVTEANKKDLGASAITLTCKGTTPTPSTCTLFNLTIASSVTVVDKDHFTWKPKEGADCGVGCAFSAITFSKNKSEGEKCSK